MLVVSVKIDMLCQDSALMGTCHGFCDCVQLVEKMMEQARENVSAKKGGRGLRRWGSVVW